MHGSNGSNRPRQRGPQQQQQHCARPHTNRTPEWHSLDSSRSDLRRPAGSMQGSSSTTGVIADASSLLES
eukprot:COSAG01_NODE_44239_length_421_cov_0.795031_1_plen_69_part_10